MEDEDAGEDQDQVGLEALQRGLTSQSAFLYE